MKGSTDLFSGFSVNPLDELRKWLNYAIEERANEPNAFTLSTVSALGYPSGRMVLLKELRLNGLVFFTSETSRKGQQITACPKVAANFWWSELSRQICLEGHVKKISREETFAYFQKRPRGAQIAAAASNQSEPLASRIELEERYATIQADYEGKAIPMPKRFVGYLLEPERVEFQFIQTDCLHQRFLYEKKDAVWSFRRSAPYLQTECH